MSKVMVALVIVLGTLGGFACAADTHISPLIAVPIMIIVGFFAVGHASAATKRARDAR